MTRAQARANRWRSSERGFIIVPVLLIILLLATLAGALSVYLGRSAIALAVNDDRLRADALVSASLELTAYTLLPAAKETRPLNGSSTFRFAGAVVSTTYSAESNRIDLNLASKDMLTNLFRVLGVEARDAERYAGRIVGWRSAKGDTLDGERAYYRSAGANYLPRGAAFASVDEVWLVLDIPPGVIEQAIPFLTVYSGHHEISVLGAAPEVIASLPGITPAELEMFLKERSVLPREMKMVGDALGEARKSATVESSDAVRVRTTIQFDSGRRASNEAVILLDASDIPYRILAWRDETDLGSLRRPVGGLL